MLDEVEIWEIRMAGRRNVRKSGTSLSSSTQEHIFDIYVLDDRVLKLFNSSWTTENFVLPKFSPT